MRTADIQPATHCIYAAAGNPPMEGEVSGVCRTCGQAGQGTAFDSWVRDTFTDQDKLKPGGIICQACQFCFTDQNTHLAKRVGKQLPQRMRNYSHFVSEGEWVPLSKSDKPRMQILLMREPEVAVIADSGQKHILFRARVGWWQFEEQTIQPMPTALLSMFGAIQHLYPDFSKREIASRRYDPNRIMRYGFVDWRRFESHLGNWRGSALFDLALFLTTEKDDSE